jgi:hypothetical protein
MVSKHYRWQRNKREKFIDEHFKYGYLVDEFIVDKGHPHGAERHCITNNGVIIIYNVNSGKLVTKLLARPQQIKRYYENSGRKPPLEYKRILKLAYRHSVAGYNEL